MSRRGDLAAVAVGTPAVAVGTPAAVVAVDTVAVGEVGMPVVEEVDMAAAEEAAAGMSGVGSAVVHTLPEDSRPQAAR
jgi:hypothetical protein